MNPEMLDARIVDIAEGGINAAAALDFVSDPRFGGLACFVGKVRAQNLGRVVTGISYQVHATLACNLFRGFAERAVQAVDCELKLSIVHATGPPSRRRCGGGGGRRHTASRRSLPRLPHGHRGGQTRSADLEARAL